MGNKKFTTHEMSLVVDENDLLKKENLRLRREVSALQKRVTNLLLRIGDRAHKGVPRVLKVTPPHRIELIPEGEL